MIGFFLFTEKALFLFTLCGMQSERIPHSLKEIIKITTWWYEWVEWQCYTTVRLPLN